MTDNRFSRAAALFAATAMIAGAAIPASAATLRDPTTASETASDAKAKPEAKKAKRYCVDTQITGSRITTRECKTREQWIEQNDFDPVRMPRK